jgi:hypothetical protein
MKYLILLNICFTSKNITTLKVRHLLINFIFLPTFHTWLTIHCIVLECFYGAIRMYNSLFGQQLLLRVFDVRSEVAVKHIFIGKVFDELVC